MSFRIDRLGLLAPDDLAGLVAVSEAEGFRFLRRLVQEWDAGVNCFDRPGEALFAARAEDLLVGVCGLNADPYTQELRVGRIRHLYVQPSFRRRGLGRELLGACIAVAAGAFDRLRLRTQDPEAALFYQGQGFRAWAGLPDCTHALELSPSQ